MPKSAVGPFAEDPLDEVHLEPAPLIRVLAQLRFPPVVSITQDSYIAPFQESLRERYPIMNPEMRLEALLGPEGLLQQNASKVWRLQDIEEHWAVVLGVGSVALETTAYESRDDFIQRLEEVLNALERLASPSPVVVFDRLGVRYINMLRGDEIKRLREYISPEIYGPLVMEMPDGMEFLASAGQTHFRLDGPQMQARWAKLPPNAVLLPDIEPVAEPTWLLDIDVFFEGRTPFSPSSVASSARHAATHAYRFFRWVMREETFIAERRTDA